MASEHLLRHTANPFEITKAVEFSDREIAATWVDLNSDGGFFQLVSPTSPIPLFIIGGKGIGRTHLMRYYSSPLQRLRHPGDPVAGVKSDGYLGVYFRASGLNSSRFEGKNQPQEGWDALFKYYFELWIAQHTLDAIVQVYGGRAELTEAEASIANDVLDLFDETPCLESPTTLAGLQMVLRSLQRELDVAVNNAPFQKALDVHVRATPGHLIFGLPRILGSRLCALEQVRFLYLIDELENFTESQQSYLHTLIREKGRETSFMVGARLYGLRTQKTTTGEENKEGSEYENIYLDRMYLDRPGRYSAFCRDMLAQRLIEAGHGDLSRSALAPKLDRFFVEYPPDRLGVSETSFVLTSPRHGEREYFAKLRKKLDQASALRSGEIDEAIDSLSFPQYPLIEKTATFLLYQEWYRDQNLLAAAGKIRQEARAYIDGDSKNRVAVRLGHFRGDLLAQLLSEYDQKQRYLGIDTFIRLSAGLPRTVVVILKYIYRWAVFLGEAPFQGPPISEDAQRPGVIEASMTSPRF